MPLLPRITANELVRAIEKRGFKFSRSRGSHRIYRNPTSGKRTVVPFHRGKIIPPGTLLNILREAGISKDELVDLLK